jgi:hypothetical protein
MAERLPPGISGQALAHFLRDLTDDELSAFQPANAAQRTALKWERSFRASQKKPPPPETPRRVRKPSSPKQGLANYIKALPETELRKLSLERTPAGEAAAKALANLEKSQPTTGSKVLLEAEAQLSPPPTPEQLQAAREWIELHPAEAAGIVGEYRPSFREQIQANPQAVRRTSARGMPMTTRARQLELDTLRSLAAGTRLPGTALVPYADIIPPPWESLPEAGPLVPRVIPIGTSRTGALTPAGEIERQLAARLSESAGAVGTVGTGGAGGGDVPPPGTSTPPPETGPPKAEPVIWPKTSPFKAPPSKTPLPTTAGGGAATAEAASVAEEVPLMRRLGALVRRHPYRAGALALLPIGYGLYQWIAHRQEQERLAKDQAVERLLAAMQGAQAPRQAGQQRQSMDDTMEWYTAQQEELANLPIYQALAEEAEEVLRGGARARRQTEYMNDLLRSYYASQLNAPLYRQRDYMDQLLPSYYPSELNAP